MCKVQPAIYKFDFIDWGWVLLSELAEILDTSRISLLASYGALSKDYPRGILAATFGNTMIYIHLPVEEGRYIDMKGIYVPAGWANDVLRAFRAGYSSVELQRHFLVLRENEVFLPEWLSVTHIYGEYCWYWVAVGQKS